MMIEDNFLKNKNTPILDPPKPTQAEADAAQALVYDGGSHRPDLLIPPGELHGAAHLEGVIERRMPELWAEAGVDSAEQKTIRRDTIMLHREVGLDEVLSATIFEGVVDAMIADAKSTDIEGDAKALEARILADNAASRTAMIDRYGIADGEKLLARTVAFVQSKPRLAEALSVNGMGSRPDLVLAIAAHVHSNGIR